MNKYFLPAFVIITTFAKAQTGFTDSLQQKLKTYRNTIAQEKVFLHTDKTFYLTGETIWFKAYVVKADSHQLFALSKVLYIEVLDDHSKPVMQTMIELQNGTGDGFFLLPSSLNSGAYTIRAYTAWMKNFDPALFFHAALQIVNTGRRPDWSSLDKKEKASVRFYPEGGDLVENLETKLAFEIVDGDGKGTDGSGYIIANETDTVARFHPLKFGIGSFEFMPKANASYRAVVRLPDSTVFSATLPQIYKQGYVLKLTNGMDGALNVQCSSEQMMANETVYLLAHTRGEVKLASAKLMTNGQAQWQIAKSNLGEGITVFTLFNSERKPVCERLYFKRPSRKMEINLQTDASTYAKRSKVTVEINAGNNKQDAVAGNFSLTAFLLDSLQRLPESFIDDYLWLSSELKGNVESPAYYFSDSSREVETATDNLMLTHGWRRFQWENLDTSSAAFHFLPDYEGTIIRARVFSRRSGTPLPNRLCYLSAPGEHFYTGNTVSNEQGALSFVTQNVYGSAELALQTDKADSSATFELLNAYAPVDSLSKRHFFLPEKWRDDLNKRHLNVQLGNIFATPFVQLLPEKLRRDSTAFYGKPDHDYLLDEYTRFPTMEEVMREIVTEVRVRNEKNSFYFRALNIPYRSFFESAPLVLFDGVPVWNTNKLIAFDPLKIRKIEVVARRFFWNNVLDSGIVSYRTYEGNLAGFEFDPGVVLIDYKGLQLKREFYAPRYETATQLQSREPDRRNVLSWMPFIQDDGSGKKQVSFYTSDVPGRYAIIVQGIDQKGNARKQQTVIEVK
jgi:hypothetical protein